MTTTVTSPAPPDAAAPAPPRPDGSLSRRSVVRRVSRGSVMLLASAGALLRSERRAAAVETYGCCTLARKHDPDCPNDCNSYVRSWWCYSGSRLMGCHECTTGNNCWTGRFQCSWFDYPR